MAFCRLFSSHKCHTRGLYWQLSSLVYRSTIYSVWFLEFSSLLTKALSGFRKTRSTLKHHVHFETFVSEVFSNGKHVVSIFFDLEKTFDTTSWKYGIMKDIWFGPQWTLTPFSRNFLSVRKCRVRVVTSLSDCYDQGACSDGRVV